MNSPRYITLFCSLLLLLPGCGGGTTGTGIKGLSGSVVASNDSADTATARLMRTAVESARVTGPNTGDSTLTDANGLYALSVATDDGTLQIEIDVNGETSDVSITDTPNGDASIQLDVTISDTSASVTGVTGSISNEDGTVIFDDDSITINSEDGTVVIMPDGSLVAESEDGTVMVNEDGTTTITSEDGTITVNDDGSITINSGNPDVDDLLEQYLSNDD